MSFDPALIWNENADPHNPRHPRQNGGVPRKGSRGVLTERADVWVGRNAVFPTCPSNVADNAAEEAQNAGCGNSASSSLRRRQDGAEGPQAKKYTKVIYYEMDHLNSAINNLSFGLIPFFH